MEQGQEELAAQAAGPAASATAGALMAVDVAQTAAPAIKPDSLASLLGLLASTYGMHPGGLGVGLNRLGDGLGLCQACWHWPANY